MKVKFNCDNCGNEVEKYASFIKNSKNRFCDKNCANEFRKGKSNEKLKNRVTVTCYLVGCDKPVELQPHRLKNAQRFFCSRKHQFKWQQSEEYKELHAHQKKVVEVQCSYCEETFPKNPSKIGDQFNFCNNECRNSFMSEQNEKYNPNPAKELFDVECGNCGKDFSVLESVFYKNIYGHFCSPDCYWEWRSINLVGENNPSYNRIDCNCDNCDIAIQIIPFDFYAEKHNFCSQECYWEYRSKNYSGENHPRFGIEWTEEQKQVSRERVLKLLKEGKINTKTKPQLKVNDSLDSMDVEYINEKVFKYYSVDNYLVNIDLIIEVNGDYFHSNPNLYPSLSKLNATQKKGVSKDKAKQKFIKKYYHIDILYLWEVDINSNPTLIKLLIEHYIKNKGKIENYHSFNYYIDENGILKLKKNLTVPYFEK